MRYSWKGHRPTKFCYVTRGRPNGGINKRPEFVGRDLWGRGIDGGKCRLGPMRRRRRTILINALYTQWDEFLGRGTVFPAEHLTHAMTLKHKILVFGLAIRRAKRSGERMETVFVRRAEQLHPSPPPHPITEMFTTALRRIQTAPSSVVHPRVAVNSVVLTQSFCCVCSSNIYYLLNTNRHLEIKRLFKEYFK